MPSGKPIPWAEYDHLIVVHLPTMTIEAFTRTHLPGFSTKAVGARARKLGIKPAVYEPSEDHKRKIGKVMAKIGPAEVERIRELRESHSVDQIAIILGVDNLTVHRAIARHKIPLSEEGQQRAREASRLGSIGKEPWNKGGKLSEETKAKISDAVSGERNGQYGRGMTEEEKERWRVAFFNHGINTIREWLQNSGHLAKTTAATQTTEYRQAQSELISAMVLDGRMNPTCRGITTHLVTTKGGEFTTKSSYETRYVAKLETDPEVVSFAYEPLRIKYEFEGVRLWYIPDFLVRYSDGREELIEVKPERMLSLPKNKAKFEAGHDFHTGFRVVAEADLF